MIVSAEKVLAGSGKGPVGEDSAAPRQGANDPDAGWKGGRPTGALGFLFGFLPRASRPQAIGIV